MSSPIRTLGLTALLALAAFLFLRQGAEETDVATPAAVAERVDPSIDTNRVTAAPSATTAPNTGDLIAALAGDEALPAAPPPPLPPSPEPLPPWDAKLVDVLPALRARADAGDAIAACHLGLALSACSYHTDLGPSAAEIRNLNPDDEDAIRMFGYRTMELVRPGREATCAGLGRTDFRERFRYLLQAADQGVDAAAVAFVDGLAFSSVEDAVRHPELLEQYRDRAPLLVQQLLARGNARMVILMAFAADGMRSSLLPQLLDLDERSRATFLLLGALVRNKPALVSQLDWFPPDIAEAGRQQAMLIHARYFSGVRFDEADAQRWRDLFRVEACAESP